MSIVSSVIERIRTGDSCPFKLFEGIAALANLKGAAPMTWPAIFAFIDEEGAGENERLNAVLQRVETDIGLVVITKDVSDAQGGAASVEIEALKAWLRSRLIGWQPEGADDVVEYGASRLVAARNGLVTVEMTFTTAFYVTD